MPPFLFVLFGATGDLARKKLLPALYHASAEAEEGFVVLGAARAAGTDVSWRKDVEKALVAADVRVTAARRWARKHCYYVCVADQGGIAPVFDRAEELEEMHPTAGNRVYYLAVPPKAFGPTLETIGAHEEACPREGWSRLVVEKPFGQDLTSARALNALVHRYFEENRVFRIDHYLGKETVQNLLVFRFANALFEPIWNRRHVESVDILVAERVGVEGRAGYYDGVGALRDMIQNHLTQLLALVAMEPPAVFDAEGLRQEKVKVLRAAQVDPHEAVFGQYGPGPDGEEAYTKHEGVPRGSKTPTYAAVRVRLDNWRWQGVPFLLRTGKRLKERRTEITVRFRRAPVRLFQRDGACDLTGNVLRIRLQPDEGFRLAFEVKAPGDAFAVTTQELDFGYEEAFGRLPDAYETLLREIGQGDPLLFVHADEAEHSWALYAPLLDGEHEIHRYPSGSWGPDAARQLWYD